MTTRPALLGAALAASLVLTVASSPALADGTPTVTGVTAAIERPCLLRLVVAGEGFSAETNPGDSGIYVGLAAAGGMPDVEDREDQDQFAASTWVRPDQMADGTIAVALNADPRSRLDSSVDYAVYTWQAHDHSNPSQDTETPVSLDWQALTAPIDSVTEVSVAKRPKARKRGALDVTVGGDCGSAEGTVKVQATKKGKVKRTQARLDRGEARVRLPKLPRGTWRTRVTYRPSAGADQAYATSRDTVTLKVR